MAPIGKKVVAFYKYDGSNLRWEWSPKKGWFKFGTRTHLFDHTNELYKQAIPIFMDTLAKDIEVNIKQLNPKIERITAFTEFLGENSFAGSHVQDEDKELKLLDIFLFKKGFVKPKQFIEIFGNMPYSPKIVYEGALTLDFIQDVRDGRFPVEEGVICKGDDFMIKIKTTAYLTKLRDLFADQWEKYGE